MGVIYTTAEVFGEGLPQKGDHIRAGLRVRDLFHEVPAITTTLVHGSVPEKRYVTRSDLDALIVYDDESSLQNRAEIIILINKLLDQVAQETRVRIEANIWPHSDPLRAIKARMYDKLFCGHLAEAFGDPEWTRGVIDKRILEIAETPYSTDELRQLIIDYVVYKADGFTNAPSVFDESDKRCMSTLQRGLELPKAIGRKVAQFTAELNDKPTNPNYLDELKPYLKKMNSGTAGALDGLIRLDQDYSELLDCILTPGREMTQNEYRQWLETAYHQARCYGIIATGGFVRFVDSFGK